MEEYNNILVTVFTPAYNRAHCLTRLYESLYGQTCMQFEWLIVDDGSSDSTKEIVTSFINNNNIDIKYIYQENRGKHIAFNKGVENARGELFWCVDSDDYVPSDAIEWLISKYIEIRSDSKYVGICGEKYYFNNTRVAKNVEQDEIDANSIDIIYKYRIKGDLSEAFKTDILRQYPFPDHNKEKFCAESLVWNRMALKYNIKYYFNKAIYYCEYLPDGLSARSVSLRRRSPENTLTLYAELSKAEIDFIYKIRACINFWRFMRFDKLGLVVSHRMISFNSICMAPIGIICHIIDSIKMYRSL